MKFKKGDEIIVTIGKDRGKRGKIERVFPQGEEVLVEGVNIFKRHLKPRGQGKPGGIVDLVKPLKTAKIAFFCPKCHKPTRLGYQETGEGKKIREKLRICRKCGEVI